MWGPGANEGAYDYNPLPGTSRRQQENLKDFDKKYEAAAKKLRGMGYVVNGSSYFKRVPDSSKSGGYRLERVGDVKTGHTNAALQPTSQQKPTAPPKADQSSSMINRSGVTPVNGSFRAAVEQGPDGKVTPSSGNAGSGGQSTDPDAPAYIEPGDGSGGTGGSEERVNENNVVQRGLTLGGVNDFLAGQGIRSLSDMNTLYSQTEKNTDMPGMELQQVGKGLGESIGVTATTPETTSNPSNDQDGASDKPDIADNVRTIRMNRGARQQEFAERPGNQSSSEPKNSGTNWANRTLADNSDRRAAIGKAFLNDKMGSLQALRAAENEAGVFKQNGKVFYNDGGELKEATENSTDFYRTAMSGKNPMEFADKPADTSPDQPAESELDPGGKVAQAFKDHYTKEVKEGIIKPKEPQAPNTFFEHRTPGL